MVSEPTRDNSVLDLFLTNNPTLVDNVSTEPGISDHETVIAVVKLRPTIQNMKLRAVHIYSKADWEGIVGVCNCSMFCCTLLHVHSSIAIILMGKRELVALLDLSSWYIVTVERLFLTVARGCLRFVIVVFPDQTHLLFMRHDMQKFQSL